MKRILIISMAILCLFSCSEQGEKDVLASKVSKIENLLEKGEYRACLDSIEMLRHQHPEAIDARKRCLVIWQEASLKLAQLNIALTDSALQAAMVELENATTLLEQNMLRYKIDSLQARYDTYCGEVRIIREKMKNDNYEGNE